MKLLADQGRVRGASLLFVTLIVANASTSHVARAQAPGAVPARGAVHVYVDGPPEATLEQLVGHTWSAVCEGSCDKDLSVTGTYRISGGVCSSPPFALEKSPGEVRLQVDASSKTAFNGGGVMIAAGSVLLTVGAAVGLYGLIANACSRAADDAESPPCPNHAGLLAGGIAIVAAAGVAIIVGTILMANNGHSTVTQAQASGPHRPSASFLSFRRDGEAARRAFVVPATNESAIFSVRF